MAVIEVRKYGISAVFLDGYMPDFSELKKIDWDYAAEHKLSKFLWMQARFRKIRKHLEPGARNQSPIIKSAIYGKLIKNIRLGFCPYTARPNRPCDCWFNPSKGPDAMKYSFASHLSISPEEAYDIFNADAKSDLSKEKGGYASLMVVVDRRRGTGCQAFKDCNENWMDFLMFEPKKRKDHSNFDILERYMKNILIEHMIMMEHEYFDDRRLSDFFR